MASAAVALPRNPRPGVEQWVNPRNGLTVLRLHYTCDPRKRSPEWKRAASKNMHPRAWERDYEINWSAPAGEPVVPEYVPAVHRKEFTWDRNLRLLRWWDFGFVSPVVLFAQMTEWGQVRIRRELCPFNTPLDQLLPAVKAVTMNLGGLDAMLARDEAWDVGGAEDVEGREQPTRPATRKDVFDAGDPAAENQTDLGSSAETLSQNGLLLHTARPGTEVSYAGCRQMFLRYVIEPGIGPVPAIIIHPDCKNLDAALSGAFHLSALPPHKPKKSHPEKDVVDALRYGIDNIETLLGQKTKHWGMMARQDERVLRSAPVQAAEETWAGKQAALWRHLVEGL